MKKILALFLALAMTFALVACGDKTSDDSQTPSNDDNNTETTTGGTIRIGIAAPLTGTSAAYGELMVDGAQIAIDEVNANGGVNGKMLELVKMDDKNDPSEAALVAQRFCDDDTITAVIATSAQVRICRCARRFLRCTVCSPPTKPPLGERSACLRSASISAADW